MANEVKDLTLEKVVELEGSEDKQEALTEAHLQGFNIRPYLIYMLRNEEKFPGPPEENGFTVKPFGNEQLYTYKLSDETCISFVQNPDDGYEPWPDRTKSLILD